jgi:hypothetical protein
MSSKLGGQEICCQRLLNGFDELVSSYEATATSKGDRVTVVKLNGSGHFDILAPESQYGKSLIEAIQALCN